MEIQYIPLILAVVFTGHLALSDGSALNEVFLVQFHCISSSGNQDTCNAYLDCLFALNDQYIQPYTECMDKVAPKGGVGNCSEIEEMYESTEKRNEATTACHLISHPWMGGEGYLLPHPLMPPSPPMDTSFPPWMPRRSYLCPA
ncbi:hypothetical protein AVEN_50155-1 [Araneus ventricosus]|uniref:Uncharacterized protein n=1 Tax=Araneus ventricosus TaxID=182803 RepID=A0A4Y2TVN5_ARAVE|nr:hypothetical protein AVEN_50155-1 [Araneus ventricosus]